MSELRQVHRPILGLIPRRGHHGISRSQGIALLPAVCDGSPDGRDRARSVSDFCICSAQDVISLAVLAAVLILSMAILVPLFRR